MSAAFQCPVLAQCLSKCGSFLDIATLESLSVMRASLHVHFGYYRSTAAVTVVLRQSP
jgi:hypothetical protein